MSREDYFCAEGKPHYNYDMMYYYDPPFFTRKERAFIFKGGKSAYEIAVENGFQGTVEEWLTSLKGVSPHIGENGNWFIGDVDTNVPVNGAYNPSDITQEDIDSYFDRKNIVNNLSTPVSQDNINNNSQASNNNILTFEEIDNLFK